MIKFWRMFNYLNPTTPSDEYSRGLDSEQEKFDLDKRLPAEYFSDFQCCVDATNSFQYMADMARSNHFQLYILFQQGTVIKIPDC